MAPNTEISRRETLQSLGAIATTVLNPLSDSGQSSDQVEKQPVTDPAWGMVQRALDKSSREPKQNTSVSNTQIENLTDINSTSSNSSRPVADQNLAAIPDQTKVKAWDPSTGTKKWESEQFPNTIRNTALAMDSQSVYAADTEGVLKKLDRQDGTEMATVNYLPEELIELSEDQANISNEPVDMLLHNNYLVTTNGTGRLSVLDRDTLDMRYEFQAENPIRNIADYSSVMTRDDELVYVERGEGEAKRRVWDFSDPENPTRKHTDQIGDGALPGAALVEQNGEKFYVYNDDGETVFYDVETGQEHWRKSIGDGSTDDETSPVVMDDGTVVLATAESELIRVDPFDKEQVWKNDIDDGQIQRTSAGGDVIYAGTDVWNTYAVNLGSGEFIGDEEVGGGEYVLPGPVIGENPIFVHFDSNINQNFGRLTGDNSGRLPDVRFSVDKPTGVAGDRFRVVPSAENGDEADNFSFQVLDENDNLVYEDEVQSLPSKWDLISDLSEPVNDPGTYDLILNASKNGSDVDEYTDFSSLEALGADVSGPGSAPEDGKETYSLAVDPSKMPAVDEVTWKLIKDESVVETETKDPDQDYTPEFEEDGDYTVKAEALVGQGTDGEKQYDSSQGVTVDNTVPDPVGGGNSPEDPDEDNIFEDVNGDGKVDIYDIRVLNSSLEDIPGKDAGFFDADGNEALTESDIQRLVDEEVPDTWYDDNYKVRTVNLFNAIDSWRSGNADAGELLGVIDSWRSEKPIYEKA
jgi:outer membrane protein assembly factor BamB